MKEKGKRPQEEVKSPPSAKKVKLAGDQQLSISAFLNSGATSSSSSSNSKSPHYLQANAKVAGSKGGAQSTEKKKDVLVKAKKGDLKGKARAELKEIVISDEEEAAEDEEEEGSEDDLIVMESTYTAPSTRPAVQPAAPAPSTSTPRRQTNPASPLTLKATAASSSSFSKPTPSQDIKPVTTFASANSSRLPAKSPNDRSLDTSVYAFEPQRDVDTSGWPDGRLPFAFLVDALVIIAGTRSRLLICRILVNLIRTLIELDPESLVSVIYLATGRLGPAHEGIELGIGPKILSGAIKNISGVTPQAFRALAIKSGDIGDVAFECRKSIALLIPPPPLVCQSVFSTLLSMAHLKGNGSLQGKTAKATKLLVAAQGEEVRFLTRMLAQNLRIGAVGKTFLKALSQAFCLSRPQLHPPSATDPFFISPERRMELASLDASKSNKSKGKAKVKEEDDEGSGEVENQDQFLLAEAITRKAWAVHPNYSHLVRALLEEGPQDLDTRLPLAIGTPVQSMLGTAVRSLDAVYERLQDRPFISEAKVDGQRIQIHVDVVAPQGENGKGRWYTADPSAGTEVAFWARFFSKHHEDMTDKYPDLFPTLSAILQRSNSSSTPIKSFVIDAEIAAIDPANGSVRPFQELSYRSRKDVEMGTIKIRVGVFAFDIMFLNGESLLQLPLRSRKEKLQASFTNYEVSDPRWAKWQLVPSSEGTTREVVEKFFGECLQAKMEGIMIKLLDEIPAPQNKIESPEPQTEGLASLLKPVKSRRKAIPAAYTPDVRGDSWLKLKKDYMDNLGDSLDLVPLGAWHGEGRKAAWWSPILLGCYDSENGRWVAVCKCMSGFTDEFYKALHARFPPDGEHTSSTRYPDVDAGPLRPAIWFEPSEVWEIRGADFTLSPVYPAAQSLIGERGISIRFPRFIRMRDPADKKPEDATSEYELEALYRNQGEVKVSGEGVDEEL